MPSLRPTLLAALVAACALPASAAHAAPVAHEAPVNVAPDATVAHLQLLSDVAMAPDGRFVVSYLEANADKTETQIYVQRFAAGVTKVGDRIAVGPPSTGNTPFASIAMAADGRFAVAYLEIGTSTQRLRVQRYTAAGAPDGGVLSPDGETPIPMPLAPAIAMADDGRFAVAWSATASPGVTVTRVRAYTAEGAPTAAGITDVDTTSRYDAHPSLGMASDGRFAVSWYDYDFPPPGDPFPPGTVPGRAFAADGTPAGPRVELYTGVASQSYISPSIGLADDGSAFLAFQGLQTAGFEQDVWGRRLDAALAPRGDRFPVSDFIAYNQVAPDVAADADGDAFVAFEGQEGTEQVSYLRHFGPDGTADGGNVRVGPASPSGNLRHTNVATDGAARTAITWTFGINGAGGDVFVERFDYAAVAEDPPPGGGDGGGGGGGGTPAPGGPGPAPVGGTGTPAPAPPAAKPKPAATVPAPKVADVVALPSAKRCASRRSFSIRLRVPKGSPVVQATVLVNGKRVAVRKGARLRSTVDLRSLPKGRFTVSIELKLADGRVVKGQRRYKTCAKKERGGRPPV